ncbi:MAG: hypothetical protein Q9173_006927, partial [Seirophora scorigena]
MHLFLLLPPLTFLCPLLAFSVSVTFRLSSRWHFAQIAGDFYQTCTNLPPGTCCQARDVQHAFFRRERFGNHLGQVFEGFRTAAWTHLAPLDIAALWQQHGELRGCSGTPLSTIIGPGPWLYPVEGDSDVYITGASYIKLPQRLPDPGDQDSRWLEAEGILGLVSGGRMWTAPNAGPSLIQRIAAMVTPRGGSSKSRRRGIMSLEKGWPFAQPPRRRRKPQGARFIR